MEEQIILESENRYKKIVGTMAVVAWCISAVSFILVKIVRSMFDMFWKTPLYATYDFIRGTLPFFALLVACFALVLSLIFMYVKSTKMVITDRRVYGVAGFIGKRVDLPLDSISAVGTTPFLGGLSVATSSGRILFLGLSNRDELHKAISKLLVERQNKKPATTTIKQETSNSNADELKKYKDLLDSGVITQEEFDAKKKQLLGL